MVGAQLAPDGEAEAVEWVCGGQFYGLVISAKPTLPTRRPSSRS